MSGHALIVIEGGHTVAMGFEDVTAERAETQPPNILYGEGTQEMLQEQSAMEATTFHAAPDPQGPSPVAEEIMATISNAPAMRHVIWNRVLDTLRMAPPEGRTLTRLVELLQRAVQTEDETWIWLEEFDEQLSMETLVRTVSGSLGKRIRELMGLKASHQNPFQSIEAALPGIYEGRVRPLRSLMRRIKSVEEPEASKPESFRRFMRCWKDLKRELKSNKLAPSMREHIDSLQGSPLPPKREGLSKFPETRHPDGSISIDLTMG